jgi:predicted MFS family arabinose efflux permease
MIFSLFGSAFWALLPLIASRFGATGYGAMLASFGVGALIGALLLAQARRNLSFDAVAVSATVIFALALFGLVRSDSLISSSIFAAAAGLAYLSLLATLNLVIQFVCPGWVRARILSMYVLVLQGGFALGSILWGALASHTSVRFSMTTAAVALFCGLALAPWYRLRQSSSVQKVEATE